MRGLASIPQSLESSRLFLSGHTRRRDRSEMGQFLTPAPIACFMASLFQEPCQDVRILDPGAGMGALFAALVQELAERNQRPDSIGVVAYETDASLKPYLEKTMGLCERICSERNVRFSGTILCEDFISAAILGTENGLFQAQCPLFTHAILNPPYRKINGSLETRKALSVAGLETSNLYSAFVWLSAKLLKTGGEIVAITPRSFCNGPYFRLFRKALIDLVGFRRFHVFQSRKEAFRDDSVLQENVIFHGVRGSAQPSSLTVSVSKGDDFAQSKVRQIPFGEVIPCDDADSFIHLAEEDNTRDTIERMSLFRTSLDELGLGVSTGRVVDFRARTFLRVNPEKGTVPLLYPCHFSEGFTRWPLTGGRKPNAIAAADETRDLLVASGFYVLTKRFSAKEERRRVVAAVCDPRRFQSQWLGFENHLNYFHSRGEGLPSNLAKGLALFLNSTLLDRHFRLFSGHTQVNATDLRKMRYPTHDQLLRMGNHVKDKMPDQETIDEILEEECGAND